MCKSFGWRDLATKGDGLGAGLLGPLQGLDPAKNFAVKFRPPTESDSLDCLYLSGISRARKSSLDHTEKNVLYYMSSGIIFEFIFF